ncbi:MAG: OmpA family protein [Myxococcales bacterium]|nr:OmpA family protein [Myxococcota bacterium]MDW8283473.1 OmpA family protein [Myxococcales bacterium]
MRGFPTEAGQRPGGQWPWGVGATACLALLTWSALARGASPTEGVRPVAQTPLALRTPGLSSQGGLGLLGMPVAEGGPPWQLRSGLWVLGFSQSDYLVAGDHNASVAGGLQLDVTLGRHVEAWFTLGAASNRNDRPTTGMRQDPPLLLSLGDVSLGVKLHGQILPLVHLGIQPLLRISSGAGQLGPRLDTTSPGVDLMASVDLRRLRDRVPVRVHLRIGYLQDRSAVALEGTDCAPGVSQEACVQARIVTAAAYGIRQPRARLAVGADAALPLRSSWALGPVAEYHLEAITGEGDEVVRGYLTERLGNSSRVDGRMVQWLILGARLHTPVHLTVDAGLQASLGHPGFAMGPPLPQVAGYAALTWVADLLPPPSPPPPVVVRIQPGRLRGVVRDASTGEALSGAVVRLAARGEGFLLTDEQGAFSTLLLSAGPIRVEAERAGYEPGSAEVGVTADRIATVEIRLKRRPPPPAMLRVVVVDDRGLPLPAQVMLVRDGEHAEAPPDIAGGFLAQVAPGDWRVRVDSEGYLSCGLQVELTPGREKELRVVLRRRPQSPAVRLVGDYLAVRGGIEFVGNTAELTPQAKALLDEVVDLMLTRPPLERLRIEGHTDNQGGLQASQRLSEERAAAVRDYLVAHGVAPERLVAEGLGASQPLVPNLTPANRAKNRRIVFKLLR